MIPETSTPNSQSTLFVQPVKIGQSGGIRPSEASRDQAGHELELKVPEGDEESIRMEFILFELAFHEMGRLIPRLELANEAFE